MADLEAHFETEHSDRFAKIPKKDSLEVEEISLVGKSYKAMKTTRGSEASGRNKEDKRRVGKLRSGFPCIVCKKKFLAKSEMKNHVRELHLTRVVPCGVCGKQVKEVGMSKHSSKYHSE